MRRPSPSALVPFLRAAEVVLLKRVVGSTLGLKSIRTARATLNGFEVTRMFEKVQLGLWIETTGGRTAASFVDRLFGIQV